MTSRNGTGRAVGSDFELVDDDWVFLPFDRPGTNPAIR